LYRAKSPPRKYEEYAYVLDFNSRGKSSTVRGREGIIVTAIGEDRLTLLEVLGIPNSTFEIGEKIYIGKDGRTKVLSVLGKMEYDKISSSAQSELQTVVQTIVTANESKFVEYLNNARPLTPRIHALELIPGIGKTYMKTMLEEREKKKFESYQDLQDRVGFKDPVKHISERIMDEITGESRMNLFVKR
jgi:putative nucleotide binding protein